MECCESILTFNPNIDTLKINDETGRDFFLLGFYFEVFRNQNESNTLTHDLKDN